MMFGSTGSERPTLTNGEIIFVRIPTYVITIHQSHRQTERRTDRHLAYTALVHSISRVKKILRRNERTFLDNRNPGYVPAGIYRTNDKRQ